MSVAGTGPPRPRLAFRVGIVGHRPDRLPDDELRLRQLRETLRAILGNVRDALSGISKHAEADIYRSETPIMRAISPLAEGSDRIFAKEALDLGYELCCPMPFYREEFEKDFVPPATLENEGSRQRFLDLLDKARQSGGLTVFEMDGERAHAPEAYAAAGRVVLNQTDLLVAVWDGGEARGYGGTAQTVREALHYHVPVIWVDAKRPAIWQLLRTHGDLERLPEHAPTAEPRREHLQVIVTDLMRAELLPPLQDSQEISSHPRDYFAEQAPRHDTFSRWRFFRNLIADGELTIPMISTADFATPNRQEWAVADDGGSGPSSVTDWINRRLRDAFGWADGLADLYADKHRGAFVTSYLLAALAVFVALLPIAWPAAQHPVLPATLASAMSLTVREHLLEIICGIFELMILLYILRLLRFGRRHQWHERWTDYRLLAELIRELCFLVPLGGGKPLPHIPAYLAVYGDPARTWMYWYVRAIARETGIPAARVTSDFMRDSVEFLDRVVGDESSGQRGFHLATAGRSWRLGHRLQKGADALFQWTVYGVILRLLLAFVPISIPTWISFLDGLLLMGAAGLPALGAALEGINNQGEFIRIAKRSTAMASGFEHYAARIAALKKGPPPRLADIVPLSSDIAEAMVAEIVDWRAVVIDRRR